MARQTQDHDATMLCRRISAHIPETQVGSKQAQPSQTRIFRDLLVTEGGHAHVPNVNRLVTETRDHTGYGTR